MSAGGNNVNGRTAQIIRLSGLAAPIVLTFYGALAQYSVVDDSHFVDSRLFYGMMVIWIGLAAFQFLYKSTRRVESVIRLVLYHVLSVAYLLFVSGFSMPFLIAWIMLMLATYAYLGSMGSSLSIIALLVVVAVDSGLHLNDESIILTNLLSLMAILIVGVATLALTRAQSVDASELDRSHKQESLQRGRMLTIVNNLADAVLSTDNDGKITVYNAASLNLLNTNASLEGRRLDDVLKLYDNKDVPFSLLKQLASARGVVTRDDLLFSPDVDEQLRLEVTYSPIRSNFTQTKGSEHHDGYIIILRDVTKAKSLEEERDEFISVVSHELRTPITVAEGTLSNLQVMLDRNLATKDKIKQNIDNAHEQILFLAKMVNDLSTLSRAERGVADAPESIDVRSLVNDLYNEYARQAESKGLHFNLDTDTKLGSVVASRLYLHELLQNFITNSIKYTKEGSVTLEVTAKKQRVTFAVRDTGIGISKSDQAKIFQKFYRSEDYRTRETGGTGLGLYVAQKLARKLGTEIELLSRLNHGSSFSFELPLEAPRK